MQLVRPVVRTVGTFTVAARDLGRLQEVARVLIRHGLGLLVTNVDVPGIAKPEATFESNPARVIAAIQALGPTFIKLGQVLSTRPDVIPAAYVDALQKLQDDVEPLLLSDVHGQLVAELGQGWRDRIATFDETPLATASIAQVHRATTVDGQHVVFKVQRPGIHAKVNADLSILHLIARRTLAEFPEAAYFDPEGILDEFERSIRAELDFQAEAQNIRQFQRNFAADARVRIPDLHAELTTSRVLCMEFLDGVKIRKARDAGYLMDEVGDAYLHAAYSMLFDHGFFHGDLHPGNVLVLPGNVIGLLDFGMVGFLTRDMKDALVTLLFAAERGDFRTCSRVFFDIAIKEVRVDYSAFERDSIEVMRRNWVGTSVADMQIGRFLLDVTRGAIRHRVRAPQNYSMYFKALLTTEGLAKALIPEVDPLRAARPFVDRLIAERFSDTRFREDLFYHAVTLSGLLRRLPTSLSQVLDDLDLQRFSMEVRHRADQHQIDADDRRQNRTILALLCIAGALCGSITLSSDLFPVFGVPLPSIVFYGTALPIFLMVVWMTFRNRG